MKKNRLHYSWIILVVGITVVAGALGLSRFSYGMLLPSLQEGLNLTHNQTGLIASVNMLGYTLAALAVGRLSHRYGPRMVIGISLLWAALTLAAVGLAGSVVTVLILRFFTGVGSAGANIAMMGLSSSWFAENRRGSANGFLVGGSGLAILLTGWLVPQVLNVFPEYGWRLNWLFLGILVLVFALLSLALIRNHPSEKGLLPLGANNSKEQQKETEDRFYGTKEIMMFKGVPTIALIYFCFGASYIIYVTFFVNYLVTEKAVTQVLAGEIWSLVGFLSIGSAIIWGSLSDMIGRAYALMTVFFLQTISYVLLAGMMGITYIWISAIIFGLTAWSIPGIMASYCGDLLGSKNATGALGLITLFFSIGSVLAPSIAGYIRELSDSFAAAFYLAALLALLGGVLSLYLGRRNSIRNHA